MKSLRLLEKIAYGDGTPDELADIVPSWGDIYKESFNEALGDECYEVHKSILRQARRACDNNDTKIRWLAAIGIAHHAGCPPHWADMGMVALGINWGAKDTWLYVRPEDGKWRVAEPGVGLLFVFDTELEARCWVADRLISGWRDPR